jgi:hypothetical protein
MITSDTESYNKTIATLKRGTTMNEQFITDKSGQKISVILPIHEYDELLEDLRDLATVAELKNEPTVSLDSVIKKLKANDLL